MGYYTCKNICTQYHNVRYNPYYRSADKWCTECRVAFKDAKFKNCPCCGMLLRVKRRQGTKKEYSKNRQLSLAGKLYEKTKCSFCGGSTTMLHRQGRFRPYPSWRKIFKECIACEQCFQKYYATCRASDPLATLKKIEAMHRKGVVVYRNLIAAFISNKLLDNKNGTKG